MKYVCKSLRWWHHEGLVLELKSELSLHEMAEYWSPVTMALRPISLTVTIPMDVRCLTELQRTDALDRFMQKLMQSPMLPDMESLQRERISTALTSLVSSVLNSSSTRVYGESFTIQITE